MKSIVDCYHLIAKKNGQARKKDVITTFMKENSKSRAHSYRAFNIVQDAFTSHKKGRVVFLSLNKKMKPKENTSDKFDFLMGKEVRWQTAKHKGVGTLTDYIYPFFVIDDENLININKIVVMERYYGKIPISIWNWGKKK